jgi:hypothetical protein
VTVDSKTSRFPSKERLRMPGSTTTPSQERTRDDARSHVAFRLNHGVGTRELKTFAAQWPACALLYRRFADALTGAAARLEVDMIRYIFIVEDFHFVFLAGLPAHGSIPRRRYGFKSTAPFPPATRRIESPAIRRIN